jgi:hypothetical protein
MENVPGEPSATTADEGKSKADHRVRPGRRTVEERQQAVLDLFAGKALLITRTSSLDPASDGSLNPRREEPRIRVPMGTDLRRKTRG